VGGCVWVCVDQQRATLRKESRRAVCTYVDRRELDEERTRWTKRGRESGWMDGERKRERERERVACV
jgi:hypothetical protein